MLDDDAKILREIVAGRIAFSRIRRRWGRGVSRLLDAGMIDLWVRSRRDVVATLSAFAAELLCVELDESPVASAEPLPGVDPALAKKPQRDDPVWRVSSKLKPCWRHPVKCPREIGFFELKYPNLIPAPVVPDPFDLDAEPVEPCPG